MGYVVDDDGWMELSTAIEVLREQLVVAAEQGAGQGVRFGVGKVEVEFGLEARRVGGGGGAVRFGVFSLEGKAELSSAATHRVKLELIPQDEDGEPLRVAVWGSAPPPR